MAIIYPSSKKKKSIALLLCFFLGIFGAHRFYLGKPKTGALYLIGWGIEGIGGSVYPDVFTDRIAQYIGVILVIFWLIDFLLICFGSLKDGKGLPLRPMLSRNKEYSTRKKGTALFLCIFLGWLGIHQFYLGRTKRALIYMFTFGVFGYGWFCDALGILLGTMRDADGLPLS